MAAIDISELIAAVDAERFRVTDHADEEAQADSLKLDDVLASLRSGEILRQYPDDRPYPSCLLYGSAPDGSPVHSVWGYNEANGWAVLITVYRPDPELWVNWRERRPRA